MNKSESQHGVVVHVGLGKTGTTSLQKYVYPLLEKNSNVIYNFKEGVYKIESLHELSYDQTKEVTKFEELWKVWDTDTKKYFFSREGLIGWNPDDWERNCLMVKRIFGENATIIITLRDPESYLRSTYQQNIQDGIIKKPEEFFLNDEAYKNIISKLNSRLGIFRIDKFTLQNLIEMYQKNFKEVFVVPIEEINNLRFLSKIFKLENKKHKELCFNFNNAPKINQSYSDFAMRLTFKKESFLKYFGIQIYHYPKNNLNFFVKSPVKNTSLVQSSSINNIYNEKIKKYFNWNVIMNKIINKLFPYKKYCLPLGSFPDQKINIDYYNMIKEKSHKYGYWVVKKSKDEKYIK
jgi:hypothetical protein